MKALGRLVSFVAGYRHGPRTHLHSHPEIDGLNGGIRVMAPADNITIADFAKDWPQIRVSDQELKFQPGTTGLLTSHGYDIMVGKGMALKKYLDAQSFNSAIDFYATSVSRVTLSALGLATAFPGNPVYIQDKNHCSQDAHSSAMKPHEKMHHKNIKRLIDEKYPEHAAAIRRIGDQMGIPVGQRHGTLFDYCQVAAASTHGFRLDMSKYGITSELEDYLGWRLAARWRALMLMECDGMQPVLKSAIGDYLEEMILKLLDGKNTVYAWHDSTLVPLLCAICPEETEMWPDFGDSLRLELREQEDTSIYVAVFVSGITADRCIRFEPLAAFLHSIAHFTNGAEIIQKGFQVTWSENYVSTLLTFSPPKAALAAGGRNGEITVPAQLPQYVQDATTHGFGFGVYRDPDSTIKVLLGDHIKRGPDFPGGKREHGESVEECVRRELREEIALTGDYTLVPLYVEQLFDKRDGKCSYMIYYLAVDLLPGSITNALHPRVVPEEEKVKGTVSFTIPELFTRWWFNPKRPCAMPFLESKLREYNDRLRGFVGQGCLLVTVK